MDCQIFCKSRSTGGVPSGVRPLQGLCLRFPPVQLCPMTVRERELSEVAVAA